MGILKYKLVKRSRERSEVGPYENLTFLATDSDGQDLILYARMESDGLFPIDMENPELEDEFDKFLGSNFDLLHYYIR